MKESKDIHQSSERNQKEFLNDIELSSEDQKVNYRDELTIFMK
jgi:hypothetical protein